MTLEVKLPEIHTVYGLEYIHRGPYTLSNGRLIMQLEHKETHERIDVYYARYIMCHYVGRLLTTDETVDHIDRNILNNDVSNLCILSRKEHGVQDVFRLKDATLNCPVCNKEFTLSKQRLSGAKWRQKRGKKGPFCSHNCAGIASLSPDLYVSKDIVIEKYSMKDEAKKNVTTLGG